MTASIIGLRGAAIPVPRGEPVEDVVEDLKWVLTEAESGNIRACAIAYVLDDGTDYPHTSYRFSGSAGQMHWLENALQRMIRAFNKWMDGD